MSETATITITSGPDRGKVFRLSDELVHVGRGSKNQVELSDPMLADHQASIVSRNGRYAIYTPLDETVEVDGNTIPSQRWVWLPARARIRISERTALQFHHQAGPNNTSDDEAVQLEEVGEADMPAQDVLPTPSAPSKTPVDGRKLRPRRGEKSKRASSKRTEKKSTGRTVARFITDQQGDPLVKLGEDGQLPELTLDADHDRKSAEKQQKQSNPLVVYAAVAFSFVFSIAMLLLDAGSTGSSVEQRTRARNEIREFYGSESDKLEAYQRSLREARRAASRHDWQAERQAYRKVLNLLNSEDNNRFTGLTGSPENDERLRKLIAILLSR